MILVGCQTATLKTAPGGASDGEYEPSEPAEDEPEDDDPDPKDDEAPDAGPDVETDADSGASDGSCPPPAKIRPAETPRGYLAPVRVTVSFLADGDSGRFNFPEAPGQEVRMLFVNTEESGGAEETPFGVQTKGIVHKWIRNAATIEIAVREDREGSKTPDVDPYGRWLSLIFLDGELLQTRIVREGLSVYYTQFGCAPAPVHDALLHAEAEANDADRGIWGPGEHNDYEDVLPRWIGNRTCRPNPFLAPYCP